MATNQERQYRSGARPEGPTVEADEIPEYLKEHYAEEPVVVSEDEEEGVRTVHIGLLYKKFEIGTRGHWSHNSKVKLIACPACGQPFGSGGNCDRVNHIASHNPEDFGLETPGPIVTPEGRRIASDGGE